MPQSNFNKSVSSGQNTKATVSTANSLSSSVIMNHKKNSIESQKTQEHILTHQGGSAEEDMQNFLKASFEH